MLCQRCNKRPATVFTTGVIDGTSTRWSLCEECDAMENSGAAQQTAAALAAGCLYCGAKVGSSVCPQCSKELHWFMELKGFSFPKEELAVEQRRKTAAQWLEVMNHMNEWVAKGKKAELD